MAIIFVSHRLAEVFAISDRIVVMRDGRIRGATRTSRRLAAADRRARWSATRPHRGAPRARSALGETALEVRGLGVFDPRRATMRVADLDLAVRKGEIVGLFGLLGAGCIEAALAIYGAWPGRREGAILVDGRGRRSTAPTEAVALGLGLMAQDRRDCLIADQSVADNIGIASLDKVVRQRRARRRPPARRRASTRSTRLHIKAPSIDVEVRTLSGGNQQKVQIARWLAADARILVLIDPTRGVDVGARREIKRIWFDLAAGACDPARLDRRRGTGRRLRPGHRDAARPTRRRARRARISPSGIFLRMAADG